jgi:hypothetical protein
MPVIPECPIRLIECPFPGRLVLGLQKYPDLVFVATYEDRAFQALYDAARTARESLDLEVLAKSARQQIFYGAQFGVETTQHMWAIDPDIQIVLCTAYSDYSWGEMFERLFM